MRKRALVPPWLVLLTFFLIAAFLGLLLLYQGGPSQSLVVLIIPPMVAALLYPRWVSWSMAIIAIGVSLLVLPSVTSVLSQSLRTVLVLSVTMLMMIEIIYVLTAARVRVEQALRQSEDRYRQMFLGNSAIKLLIDPSDGTIIDANPAAREFYGYGDALVGMRISLINTLPPDVVALEMARAREQHKSVFYFKHRLASGDIRDVEVRSSPVVIEGRTMLYSIIHDITERLQAEAEREQLIGQLQEAIVRINTLQGILPICSSCKKIRDGAGGWNPLETYIAAHSKAEFTHSICPDCAHKIYPDLYE